MQTNRTISRPGVEPMQPKTVTKRPSTITVRMATTPDEYAIAFNLVYQSYYNAGIMKYRPCQMRISPSQLWSRTLVFLAYMDGKPVGTMSLCPDGKGGLPSEAAFPEETIQLRDRRKRIFEIGSLVIVGDNTRPGLQTCLEMFRYAWIYARTMCNADTFCVYVRVKHEWFYRRLMNFVPFSKPRSYTCGGINVSEAIALEMDLDKAEEDFKNRFDKYGDSPRNLYRWFVRMRRSEAENQLRRECKLRKEINFEALHGKFAPFIGAH